MITIDKQIAEAERELAMRKAVYPGLVARHKLTDKKMVEQIEIQQAIIETLKQIATDASRPAPQAVAPQGFLVSRQVLANGRIYSVIAPPDMNGDTIREQLQANPPQE